MQRFFFNFGIRRVQQLREATVRIVEKHHLEETFIRMNESLPDEYRRTQAVKLCDEIMYVIGFAGIAGTAGCVTSVGQFVQAKKPRFSTDINFGQFNTSALMVKAYSEQPDLYIREVCRLDPPVTSATHVIKEPMDVSLAGRSFTFPEGTLNQYVVSMANRDAAVFIQPTTFEPGRPNPGEAVTWNGQFSLDVMDRAHDEELYPRICPGRFLSIEICQAIINHAIPHV